MKELSLRPFQVPIYEKALEIYENEKRACAIMPTGTGKSYVIAKMILKYGKTFLITTNEDTEKQFNELFDEYDIDNVEIKLYQGLLAMSDDEIKNITCDFIVADEMHRIGAPEWGKKFDYLLETHQEAKVFGATATPKRGDGRDTSEEYFGGNKACEFYLEEAIVREILMMPVYVSTIYTLDIEFSKTMNAIRYSKNSQEEKNELINELKAAKNHLDKACNVPDIIKKYIDNYNGRYIVFTKNREHLYEMKDAVISWFRESGYENKIYSYIYYAGDNSLKNNANKFIENNKNGLKLLFVIDKLNEGKHFCDDVDGCILLRTTGSERIYYQQIGRVFDEKSKNKKVIFDFVNNFENYEEYSFKERLQEKIKERQEGKFKDCSTEFDIDKFYVIDNVLECKEVFNKVTSRLIEREWTSYEEDILKRMYGLASIDEIMELIHRTKIAIKLKAYNMGLEPNYFWTNREEQILKEKYLTNSVTQLLEFFPGRTVGEIYQKIIRMGLKKRDKAHAIWTNDQIEILKYYYPIEGMLVVDRLPDKTKTQVKNKVKLLKLTKFKEKTKYVYKSGNKFEVKITVNKKVIHFGTFNTEEEAIKVANEKAKEYGKTA